MKRRKLSTMLFICLGVIGAAFVLARYLGDERLRTSSDGSRVCVANGLQFSQGSIATVDGRTMRCDGGEWVKR
jgi:hypothetical protein